MKSDWALGCMTRGRYPDGRNAMQNTRDYNVSQMARGMAFRIETVTRGQVHRAGCTGGPDPIKCVPARLWRALDLRESERHAN
jgi:hypothetical protein